MIPRLAPLLFLVAAASTPAADTLLVGPPGSGAPYSSVPVAVDAAQPGDTVCVLAGSYLEYREIVISKPLTLLGAGSGSTVLEAKNLFFVPEAITPLVITGLAAGEEVRVMGFTLVSTFSKPSGLGACTLARVSACAGPVVLADVVGEPTGLFFPKTGALHVSDSSQVLLDRCSFTIPVGSIPQPGFQVESSSVYVNACTFVGGSWSPTLSSGTSGVNAIFAVDSTLRLAATSAIGGPASGGDGGEALRAQGSAIHVTGGAGNLLSGSAGFNEGVGAPAVILDPTSVLTTDAHAELAAGADGDGAVTAPVVVLSGGVWRQLGERLAGLTVVPTLASAGGSVEVQPSGEPAGTFMTAFSLGQGPALALPGVAGLAVLDVQAFAPLGASTLDAGGEAPFAVAISPVGELAGVSVLLQGLCVSPSGLASFSAPALVAIVP